jgi:hypothetical protein
VLRGIVQSTDPQLALQDLQAAINEAAWSPRLSPPLLPRTTYVMPRTSPA